MLERQSYQEHRPDEASDQVLTPSYFYEILKRRALYFAVPFLLIFAIGSLITAAWPSRYVSQGTLLVSSQEIPSDLVRPTVAALANDRIQVIQQRIMTRDNLLTIAKKFQLTPGWRERIAGTELADFVRERIRIKPAEVQMQSQTRKDAIAFTVSFDYERPDIAMKVANELLTMILNEDVRSRTEFAAETSKFMAQEVARLEGQLRSINTQISDLIKSNAAAATAAGAVADTPESDDAKTLATLKAELVIKSASFSDTHPDIKALKRRIRALEKSINSKKESGSANASAPAVKAAAAPTTKASTDALTVAVPGLDTLETQRLGLREELNKATQKLSAARMGESMERGQHSERLEVIEQPSLPLKPDSPKKPKILAFVFALALMSGGGMVFAAEMLDHTIRRSTDLFSIIDSHLIVTVPYISTHAEIRRKKSKIVIASGIVTGVILAGLTALYFVLPPLDVLFDKAMAKLFG